MQKKNSPSIIVGIALGFVLFGYTAFAEFKPPDVAPPGGNVEPPVNVSNNGQIKKGPLVVNAGVGANSIDGADPETGLRAFGYVQLDRGSPPVGNGECDDNGEYGRMFVDIVNERLYICMNSDKWKYVDVNQE
jgi:hypothetical protein